MDISTINKKQLMGIAVILFLLIAIPITIYLVRQTQIFKPKATGTGSRIEVYSGSAEVSGGATTTQPVQVKVIYEPTATAPPAQPIGNNTVAFELVPYGSPNISINARFTGNGIDRSLTLNTGPTFLNNIPDGIYTVTLSNIPSQFVISSVLVNGTFNRSGSSTFSVTVPTTPGGVFGGLTVPSNTSIGINLSLR